MFNEQFIYLPRTVFGNPTLNSCFKFLKRFGVFYLCRDFVPEFWTYRGRCFNAILFSAWYAMATFRLIPQIIGTSTNSKTSFINSGAIPALTLNISVISFCRFRWCKVVELSLLSSSSKDESKSLYTTRKALSWSLLMQVFSFRLWKNFTTGQYEKWQITKEFIIGLLCSKFIDDASLDRAFIFLTCFLTQRFNMSFKVQVTVYFDSQKFFGFTTGNCFISDCNFTGVITRWKKVIFTRIRETIFRLRVSEKFLLFSNENSQSIEKYLNLKHTRAFFKCPSYIVLQLCWKMLAIPR